MKSLKASNVAKPICTATIGLSVRLTTLVEWVIWSDRNDVAYLAIFKGAPDWVITIVVSPLANPDIV